MPSDPVARLPRAIPRGISKSACEKEKPMKNSLLAVCYGLSMTLFSIGTLAQSITTSTSISGSPFCAGSNVSVPYTIGGTFVSGNVFTAQLSDRFGSFASPVTIGTRTATNGGTITANIPIATTVSGVGYRIRVVSSNPAVIGTDNAINLTINAPTITAITPSLTTLCQGESFTIAYTVNCSFSNTGFSNVFTAELSDATGSFSSPTVIGSLTATGSGTISATLPAGIAAGTQYRIRITSSNPARTSADNGTNLTINAAAGNPTVFGNNVWNVYCYGGQNFNNYYGFYTENNISFNTTSRWAGGTSPSNADASTGLAYAGCPITNASRYSYIHKRTGFTCGYYQLSVPAHDDNVTILIDGVQVFQHIGCCDAHGTVWTGFLGPSSSVEAQVQNNGAGNSYLTLTFTAVPTPLTISPNVSICPASSTTLTVSAAVPLDYTWSPAASLNTSTGTTVVATPASTTTYTATGTDATTGCSVTGSTTVTVSNTFTPTLTTTTNTICSGVTTATLTASGANTYTWSPSTGLSATTGATVIANPASTTTYTVTASNNCGTQTASQTVTVQNVPPTPLTSEFGNGVWNVYCHNNTSLTNYYGYYTENNLNFNTTTRWSNNAGPTVANSTSGLPYAGCTFGSTYYSMSFKRTGIPCNYYAINIPSHDDYVTILINGVQVFQHNGCCDAHTAAWTGFISPSMTVEIQLVNNAGPGSLQISITPTTPPITVNTPITLCAGTSTTLTASSTISGATFAWTPNDGTLATPSNATTLATPTASTTYTVTMTDAANTGCTATATVPITLDPLANTTVTPTTAVITCPTAGVTLTANGASSYTWSPSSGLSATTGFSVTALPTTTTTYTVTGTTNCNAKDATTTITVIPLPSTSTYPTNTWNVYGFNDTNLSSYQGFYTENGSGTSGYDFNTTTRWTSGTAPSTANATNGNAWQGCTMNATNISLSFKRTGFACGIYQVNIPTHDDAFRLIINGTQVASHNGCCDSHSAVWTGVLNPTSLVELQLVQGGGSSYLSVQFVPITQPASQVVWTGQTNTDWFTASNWCGTGVPTLNTDVLIPSAGPSFMPVIGNSGAQCRNITINGSVAAGSFNSAIAAATLSTTSAFNIDVYGNWTNNGSFSTGTGTVSFLGSTTGNTITSAGVQTFYNLVINKPNNITIASGIQQISNNLSLVSGIVNQNGALEILQGASVSGASNSSYINGTVKKVGNTAFTFPVGAGGFYRPISISAPAVGTDHFTAQYFYSNPNGSYPNAQRDATLDHISGAEYWILNRTGGSSNVNVTLSWDTNSGGVTNLSTLRVARWDAIAGKWKDHGNGSTTGNSTAGSVTTSAVVTSFSPFALASANGQNPLPVDIVDFGCGLADDQHVRLTWATVTEQNADVFDIERSTTGKDFKSIGQVKAHGNSNIRQSYSFQDNAPLPGKLYYRLKETDFDGKTQYSPICQLTIENTETASTPITLYPNPAQDDVMLDLKDRTLIRYQLVTPQGQAVAVPERWENDHVLKLHTSGVPAGLYLLEVQLTDRQQTFKLIITH